MLTEDLLTTLSDRELRLYLLLTRLAASNPSHGLTEDELARRAMVPTPAVMPALATLSERELITTKKNKITTVGETPTSLIVTKSVDKARASLEAEVEALTAEIEALRNGETCGLGDQLPNEQGTVIRVAEHILGRGLTHREAYHIGELMSRFGPARVKQTLQQQARGKNPLRATYAILNKGGKGKAFEKDAAQEVVAYWQPDEGVRPWAIEEHDA